MKILIELSREYPDLPKEEALSCMRPLSTVSEIYSDERILIVETGLSKKAVKTLGKRLAFSFNISILQSEMPIALKNNQDAVKTIKREVSKFNIPPGTFRIKVKKYSARDSAREESDACPEEIEKEVGSIWEDKKVNLVSPTTEVRIVLYGEKAYCGVTLCRVDRSLYENRRPHLRPFFSPVSLHPRIARGLVNLAEIRAGDRILDPFCGTGGFLIEAGLLGAKVFGSDAQEKMVEGCKKNLEWFGIKDAVIEHEEISKVGFYGMNAVVADFPYGRSSKAVGMNEELYEKSFRKISEMLVPGGFAVTGLPDEQVKKIGEKYLTLKKIFPCYVHKHLTRYFLKWVK
jgi:tRNA (guanine10-N2)-dimethyltransferase